LGIKKLISEVEILSPQLGKEFRHETYPRAVRGLVNSELGLTPFKGVPNRAPSAVRGLVTLRKRALN